MQRGIYSASQGRYWQIDGEAPEWIVAGWPEDHKEIPVKPGDDFDWDNKAGKWVEFPPEPIPDSARILSRPQFAFLLALTGFDDVWDALGAGAKAAGDMVAHATLKAERDRSLFRLDRTLEIVDQFRATAAQIAPDVDLSEAAIRAAWDQAEAFMGAANG